MRIICSLFILVVFYSDLYSQEVDATHKAFLWRGFDHRWTYNHRIKRIGDYIVHDSTIHTSATGTGKDSAYYKSYYTSVTTPDAVFFQGDFRVPFEGTINTFKQVQVTLRQKTKGPGGVAYLQHKDAYVTLLNGFDMLSNNPADKIQVLKIAVEDGRYDSLTGDILIDVHIALVLNCQTAECCGARHFNYTFNLYILIMGIDKDAGVAASQNYFLDTYRWNTCKELPVNPIEKILNGDLAPGYTQATVGIKSFGITLNKAEHLLELHNSMADIVPENSNSRIKLSGKFMFKQWKKGMQHTAASPFQSLFSFRQSGYAVMDMDLVMLQFKHGTVTYGDKEGQMYWPGHNANAENNAAAKSRQLIK